MTVHRLLNILRTLNISLHAAWGGLQRDNYWVYIIGDPSTLKQRALSADTMYINTASTSYPSGVHGGAEVGGLRYTSEQIRQDLSITRFVHPEPH